MKHTHTFENFLNKNLNEALKKGDSITHRIYNDVKGTIIAGPVKYFELEKIIPGIEMPEDWDFYVKPYLNQPVWIAILLDDGQTQIGANIKEFK